MTFSAYILIGLYLLIHKPLQDLILGYNSQRLPFLHDEEDIWGERLKAQLRKNNKRWKSAWLIPISLSFLSILAYPYFNWELIHADSLLHFFVMILMGFLTWKFAFVDIDLATGGKLIKERLLLILACAGTYFFPGLFILFVFIAFNYFKGWLHHNQMPMRLLMTIFSLMIAAALLAVFGFIFYEEQPVSAHEISTTIWLVLFAIYATHYWVPAAKKLRISSWKHPWYTHNQLHLVIASAYSWGWLNFWPKKRVLTWLKYLKHANIPFQILTLFFELGVLFMLFDPLFASIILLGTALMHISIFLCTGILFWEYILVNMLLFIFLQVAGPQMIDALFCWENALLCFALASFLPLLKLEVWKPFGLGWWDTGYAGRIHWELIGESGKVYGLYNHFMDPHERLFGRVYGYFLLDKKIIFRHIGEVRTFAEREAVLASNGELEKLQKIEAQFGTNHVDKQKEEAHDSYLKAFFQHLNEGKPKYILPQFLHFLKPWGGQYYYWGKQEAYQEQEKVKAIQISFRSYFFTEKDWIEIADQQVKRIEIIN